MSTTSRKRRRQIDQRRHRRAKRKQMRQRITAGLESMRRRLVRQRREHARLTSHPRIFIGTPGVPTYLMTLDEVRKKWPTPGIDHDAESVPPLPDDLQAAIEEVWEEAYRVSSMHRASYGLAPMEARARYLLTEP